jgi:hypothetical protein
VPGRNLLSRERLSGFLLESEAAQIEQKVESELENLTLSTYIFIYNFKIILYHGLLELHPTSHQI